MADPLDGVTQQAMLHKLLEALGFAGVVSWVPCLATADASSSDALAILEGIIEATPGAAAQLEGAYLFHLRTQKRTSARVHGDDVRAAAKLLVDATKGVMGVVENMHNQIGAFPIVTNLVYAATRGVTGLVGLGVDAALAALAPALGSGAAGPEREAVVAALNGVIGDRLADAQSPLAIAMALQPPLAGLHPGGRGGRLLVMVHGSSMNDRQWSRLGHDHGRALARDLGFVPVYAHYNSGRHVSTNGAELAALLEKESAPFDDVVIVAHSMGGLVARSAVQAAHRSELAWRAKVRALVTLGTPHHGAPLERSGNLFEVMLGVTPYTAPLAALGAIRSAGVTDLRFGNVVDADWQGRERFELGADPRTPTPLPDGVRCFAVAASTGREGGREGGRERDDLEALPGDGLVPVPSALGKHKHAAFALRFTDTRVVFGTSHLDLLSSAEVYALVRDWVR